MSVQFKSYSATSVFDNETFLEQEVRILVGATGGTIVKSLEIIGVEESSCNVSVYRTKTLTGNETSTEEVVEIPIQLKANDYLLLWEGFFVIESGTVLSFKANKNGVKVVANVVEM